MSATHLVGVDVGIGDELDLEPVVDVIATRLDEVGAGHGVRITTHAVTTTTGTRGAVTVSLQQAVTSQVQMSELVRALAQPFATADHLHGARGPGVWSERGGTAGPEALVEGARAACRALREGLQGRSVRYAGRSQLVGEVTIAQLSLVAPVVVIGGVEPPCPSAVVVTRDFVRPRLVMGDWVIHVQAAADGSYVPFETPTPTRCCQDK
ncbi:MULTISPECIES: hypothetical protein [unclassified Knoellia]|uniref:hypothetical protein n=1 Tax=Knoellia altitudinis TaxID=3404795 RepID=UPI003608F4DB